MLGIGGFTFTGVQRQSKGPGHRVREQAPWSCWDFSLIGLYAVFRSKCVIPSQLRPTWMKNNWPSRTKVPKKRSRLSIRAATRFADTAAGRIHQFYRTFNMTPLTYRNIAVVICQYAVSTRSRSRTSACCRNYGGFLKPNPCHYITLRLCCVTKSTNRSNPMNRYLIIDRTRWIDNWYIARIS